MKDEDIARLCCSFCGKNQSEVKKLIAGPTVYICDECIGLCNDIIADEVAKEPPAGQDDWRPLVLFYVDRLDRESSALVDCFRRAPLTALPESVRREVPSTAAALQRLRTAVQAWGSPPVAETLVPDPLLRPALARISIALEALHILKRSIDGLVPAGRLVAIDWIASQLERVREGLAFAGPDGKISNPDPKV